MTTPDEYRALRAHVEGFWPERDIQSFSWTLGPIGEVLPRFRVLRVAPRSNENDEWIYVSHGAFEVPCGDEIRLEFVISSPTESPSNVETLAMVAHLHADEQHRLSLGKSIEIGRPWIEGANCDFLLVALPYPYGPRLEWAAAGSKRVRFLWLMPVTRAEANFVLSHGAEALEQRFDTAAVNAVAVRRESVV